MSSAEPETTWSAFTGRFFSSPNELAITGDGTVESVVAQAEAAWTARPSTPFFLPVRVSGWSYWYAACPDKEQSLWVENLIWAHIGSYVDGVPVPADADSPMDEAIRTLVGAAGSALRVRLPRNPSAETQVHESLQRLARLLATRPHRRIQLTQPLGRLIGDLSDACAAGAEARAKNALEVLEQDHRLARSNKLFLRLQYLAAFERWDQMQDMEEFPDLLRLDRPVLASDALARLAMSRLASAADLADFEQATAEFGSLVGSVAAIRSPAGAQYYAYWSLAAEETSEAVASRLLEAGWLEQANGRAGLALLLRPADPTGVMGVTANLADLQQALDSGRLDTAIDVLALLPPSPAQLPVLVGLVTRTLNTRSIRVLQDWRQVLGESAIDDVLAARTDDAQHDIALAAETFGDALQGAFADDMPAAGRARMLEDIRAASVSRLMPAGALRDLVEIVRPLSRSVSANLLGNLIDLLLDLERDLFAAAGDVPDIQDLRLIIVETWALGDESGDHRRAERLLDLISRMLSAGVSAAIFGEISESLRAARDPFLTDAELPLGLEAIELLVANQAEPNTAVLAFASAILSRIGAHNSRRIEVAYLETARALATEFGLDLAIPKELTEAQTAGISRISPPDGTFVAIYSLIEPAANRAAAIVSRWYPGIRVETLIGKVASDTLRSAARNADILVVADRAAAHAATDALKAARGSSPIYYATGKGTASLVQAVLRGLRRDH